MSTATDEARSIIERALVDLDSEQQRLEGALKELNGGSGRSPSGGPKKRQSGSRGQRPAEVLADLKANPGATAAQTAKRLRLAPSHVHSILGKLRTESKVTKKGPAYEVKEPAKKAPAKKAAKKSPKAGKKS